MFTKIFVSTPTPLCLLSFNIFNIRKERRDGSWITQSTANIKNTLLFIRNNRLIFIPTSLLRHPKVEVILLDNNLLTEIPNFVFNLPALKVLSFSGNQLLPEPQKIKPVFSPDEKSILEVIATVEVTESPGCNIHQEDKRESSTLYEEIKITDRNHAQPLKGFQSCSRCVSDILNKYERSDSNIKNEKTKKELLQIKKENIKLQTSHRDTLESDLRKYIAENKKINKNRTEKVSVENISTKEMLKISWELLKHSTLAFSCHYKLKSRLRIFQCIIIFTQ